MIEDHRFYKYPSGMYVCGACVREDIKMTQAGNLVGEEVVTVGMAELLPEGEAYQCDNCLVQSPEYEELGDAP